jgi:uncharacterized protein YfaS (alpha-2-macroglobulin family)
VDRASLLEAGGSYPVDPAALAAADGRVDLRLEGTGTAWASLVLSTWSTAQRPPATESWLEVERRFFRLRPVRTLGGAVIEVEEPLADGDRVASGERVRVRLRLTAHRSLDHLVVEDPRPAGLEPVDRLSGGFWSVDTGGRREVREEAVVLFLSHVREGEQVLEHVLRAESPGVFRAPPARAAGMYLADVAGSSLSFSLAVDAP